MNAQPRLQSLMSEVAQAYAEHCTSDPLHEIGLLAVSPDFPRGNGHDDWIANHWVGKNMKVKPALVPEGVDLRRVTGAVMTEDPTSNLVMWLVGFRPGAEPRLNVRMFVVAEDPRVLAEPEQWAMRQLAAFARDLGVGDQASKSHGGPSKLIKLKSLWNRASAKGRR